MDVESTQTLFDFKQQYSAIPKYGLKLKLDHKYPEKRNQSTYLLFTQLNKLIFCCLDLRPSVKQTISLIPMMLRYLRNQIKES